MNNDRICVGTWNVNSVRIRVDQIKAWLKEHSVDVAFLQEIKCQTEVFPQEAFEEMGYNCYVLGQKTYNGVAILSKIPADEVNISFPGNPCEEESRMIGIKCQTSIGYINFISVYVPNGRAVLHEKYYEKLEFIYKMNSYLNEIIPHNEDIIIGGDFNVAPYDIDVYSVQAMKNLLSFTDLEKKAIRLLWSQDGRLVDTFRIRNKDAQQYTWWDYRSAGLQRNAGLRIDYILASENLVGHLESAEIHKNERYLPKTSDHCPSIAIFQKSVCVQLIDH